MPVFLGFFVNTITTEEFVAPVDAHDRAHAEEQLHASYPAPAFRLLTTYERREMDNIMAGIDRWPCLPSKVQPPLEALLGRVRVRQGGLPPMPQATPTAKVALPSADSAHITQEQVAIVRQAVKGHPPEVQALAARLLAAQRDVDAAAPTQTPPNANSAIAVLRGLRSGTMPEASIPVTTQQIPAVSSARSLIEVLKELRG